MRRALFASTAVVSGVVLFAVGPALAQDCATAPRLVAESVQCTLGEACVLPLEIDATGMSGVEARVESSRSLRCVDTNTDPTACTGFGLCVVSPDCNMAGASFTEFGTQGSIKVVCEEPGIHDVGFADVRFASAADLTTLVPGCGLAATLTCVDDSGVVCGDGARDGDEQCDGLDLGAETCLSLGFDGGTLACTGGCRLDLSGCTVEHCGDGVLEESEACDGSNLGGETCISQGFDGGSLACTGACALDTSGCTRALCGNEAVDDGEQCDGSNLDGRSCASEGFDGGTLGCTAGCRLDATGCTTSQCGNGAVEAAEQCDGADLAGQSCDTRGFDDGTLACSASCAFDVSGCTTDDRCGNGAVEAAEQCDGADLAGESCRSLGHDGGVLSCSDECRFDTSGCTDERCGNGVRERGEECDDGNASDRDFCSSDCRITTCQLSGCPAGKQCDPATGRCQAIACDAGPRLVGPMVAAGECFVGSACEIPVVVEGAAPGVAAASALLITGPGVTCGTSCSPAGGGHCSLSADCRFSFTSLGSPIGEGELAIARVSVFCQRRGTHELAFAAVQLGTLAGVPIAGACAVSGEIDCGGCLVDADCEDGNVCTSVPTCVQGMCVGNDIDCDDGLACTIDSCETETGCRYAPAPAGASCDDGDPCTFDDGCSDGSCAGTARACPAGETCSSITGECQPQQSTGETVCFSASDHPGAAFFGNMRAGDPFTGGADADLLRDSFGPRLLFASTSVPALGGGSADKVKYAIELPSAGAWYAWGRFYYPGSAPGDANSFFIQLDGGPERPFGNNMDAFQRFHWDGDGLREYGPLAPLSLGPVDAGPHTIVVSKREVLPVGAQPRLDAVCLKRDDPTPPQDVGVRLALGMVPCDFDTDCDDASACTINSCLGGACAQDPVECSDGDCDPLTGCAGATLLCISAAADPTAVFRNDMTTSTDFTGGIDLDPTSDSLNTELVFADSPFDAFEGTSGDDVAYTVELPMSGRWYLWARMYYPGQRATDANSFYLQIDRGDLSILGNNNDFFRRWHWDGDGRLPDGERGVPIPLDLGVLGAGAHEIVVKKREAQASPRQPRLDVLCLRAGDARAPTDEQACEAGGCSR